MNKIDLLPDDEFIQLAKESKSIKQFLDKLNLSSGKFHYRKFKEKCKRLGVPSEYRSNDKLLRQGIKDSEVQESVENSISRNSTLKKLKLKPHGGNIRWIDAKICDLKLSTEHWKGQAHAAGTKRKSYSARPLKEILVKNSTYVSGTSLKRRLLRLGVLENKCSKCGLKDKWQGESITLQLEHINGISNDNRLDNLTILCPNCHSQTKTFAGRNK